MSKIMPEIGVVLARHFVDDFSDHVFGLKYSDVAKLVYPTPQYKTFIISKRDGSPRIIDEPRKRLKALQHLILKYLESIATGVRPCVHGFVRGRNIVTNAKQHCSKRTRYVLNLDLADFFPSITFKRVRGALRKPPFNFSHAVASLVAHICTHNGVLPQGAPTSPFLSNIICRRLDRDLMVLARRNRAVYTRYADDITFSFAHLKERLPTAICKWNHPSVVLGSELVEAIAQNGFSLNPNKTRIRDRSSRQEVTGLTINRFPNVRRRFIDRIRGGLHAWESKGYVAAQHEWETRISLSAGFPLDDRTWRRQTRSGRTPQLKNVLWGRLLYLKMVRGKSNLLYTRLAEKYNHLCEFERSSGTFVAPSLPIEPVAQDVATVQDAIFCVKWNIVTAEGVHVGGEGTAFAYRELNLLVTCDHIFTSTIEYSGHDFTVDYVDEGHTERELVLIRPSKKEILPARLVARSKQLDLAILRFDSEVPPFHRYFGAISSPIEIGAPGKLIGFPDFKKWNPPDILDEKVLNLLEPHKGHKVLTITGAGSIRPGNSGGPFVDSNFAVAGVAQEGAYSGRGHDMCLAASVLDDWLDTWKSKGGLPVAPLIKPPPTAEGATADTLITPEIDEELITNTSIPEPAVYEVFKKKWVTLALIPFVIIIVLGLYFFLPVL